MFGGLEPLWRMLVRYVSVLGAVYAAMRGRFEIAAGLAALWLMLTLWASHTSSERLDSGWLALLFSPKSRRTPASPAQARPSLPRVR